MKYRDMVDGNRTDWAQPTQRERSDERQVVNHAGGYVYQVDDIHRLRRFLILGTEGGTFYASERDLTKTNLEFLKAYAVNEPVVYLDTLMEVNAQNLAPRHSTTLLALAVLFTHTKNDGVYGQIKEQFPTFVRTGTHLFEFVEYALMFRKWGRGMRSMIGSWYLTKDPLDLAYTVTKYRQRGGWKHRDLLRLTHPKATDPTTRNVIDYLVHDRLHFGGESGVDVLDPKVIGQFEAVKNGVLEPTKADMLSWEMLPTESLNDPEVWRALIRGNRLPYTAMVRNLGRMTSLGVFDTLEDRAAVAKRIQDVAEVKRARLHPFNALVALKTYQQGRGFKGSLVWSPVRGIVDALDAAFYASFQALVSTGSRTLIGLDVSGSMGSPLMNSNISAREASVAMAMATLAADPDTTDMVAFTSADGRHWGSGTALMELDFSNRQRLDDIIKATDNLPFGRTDCALPLLYALDKKKVYDTFVIYTDNETWAGNVQVPEALRRYRSAINPNARMVVVGMTSTGFTIADPKDPLSLDMVGFDASAPRVIADFSAGRF